MQGREGFAAVILLMRVAHSYQMQAAALTQHRSGTCQCTACQFWGGERPCAILGCGRGPVCTAGPPTLTVFSLQLRCHRLWLCRVSSPHLWA